MNFFTNPLSKEVYESTYRYGADKGIEQTWERVSKDIASVEENKEFWEEKFLQVLKNFKFIPGGRILSNAGTGIKGTTYVNCFVDGFMGVDQDSMNGIMDTIKRQAFILKSEGGYGFCCDIMRPRGTFIEGIAGETPGSVEMLDMWDTVSTVITKGSGRKSTNSKVKEKIRKGAMMVTQSCWHPDIVEFITKKQVSGKLTKFNMSVLISDQFIQSVIQKKPWSLIFPDIEKNKEKYKKEWDGNIEKWLDNGGFVQEYHKFEDAGELWDLIMQSTYNRNEPGVLFVDRVNYWNNLRHIEWINATNPCGEQPLPVGGNCLLSSINLTQYVDGDTWDWNGLANDIPIMVRFMDNVIERTHLPLETQKIEILNKRRIGLGVLGYGSALLMMKLRYGSKEALLKTEELMQFIVNNVYMASSVLAIEKGKFPLYTKEYLDSHFLSRLNIETFSHIKQYGIRNSHLLSIQPTGNTAVLANNVSSGLEPIFSPEYYRTFIVGSPPEGMVIPTVDWKNRSVISPGILWEWVTEGDDWLLKTIYQNEVYKFDENRGLTKEVLVEDYAVKKLKEKKEWDIFSKDLLGTVQNLTIDEHVDTMEVFAKYVDGSLSKTVNLPGDFTFEAFKGVYLKAWSTEVIKGLTTYRAGTMSNVLASVDEKEKKKEEVPSFTEHDSPKRPKVLSCDVVRFQNEYEEWVAFVGILEGRPYEVFTGKLESISVPYYVEKGNIIRVKNGSEESTRYDLQYKDKDGYNVTVEGLSRTFESEYWNYAKLISGILRHGMPIKYVITLVKELNLKDESLNTWKNGVARVLKRYVPDNTKAKESSCPQCGQDTLIHKEGCISCTNCNYSKCD